jgi:Skp family chaperone for outer membrane proteins
MLLFTEKKRLEKENDAMQKKMTAEKKRIHTKEMAMRQRKREEEKVAKELEKI